MGASMTTVLEAGDWAGANVFKKHYYKALPLSFVENYIWLSDHMVGLHISDI